MLFREVVGHEHIKKVLIQSVRDNRISHAQLFLGPEGSGSLALAIAYAQYINCLNRETDDSCGHCASCQKFSKFIHPDLHFVFPIASGKSTAVCDEFLKEWRSTLLASPYITINKWYEAMGVENKQGIIGKNESAEILRKINLKSFEAEYKVMIIWMPEKMNASSANKLLKILEEPPEKTIFLLVSESTNQMLPTILSRTQIIKVPKIDNRNLYEALLAKQVPETTARNIVQLAQGNYTLALQLVNEEDENLFNFAKFQEFMRIAYNLSRGTRSPELFAWVEELAGIGREKQKSFLSYGLRLVRENLLVNLQNANLTHMTDKEADWSSKFSPFINIRNVQLINEALNRAQADIEWNGNARIIFTDLAFVLAKAIRL